MMKQLLFSIFFVLSLSAPVAVSAGVETPIAPGEGQSPYAPVLAFLTSDRFTPDRFEFEARSDDAVADLIAIIDSRYANVRIRSRAVQSLALWAEDARAAAVIDELFASTRPHQKLFPAIVVSYAARHKESAVEDLAKYAESPHAGVRLALVVALGRYGGESGYEVLGLMAQIESDPRVLERLEAYLRAESPPISMAREP